MHDAPPAEGTITLVMPSVQQAKEVLRAMQKLPAKPQYVNNVEKPYADFTALRYPVSFPLLVPLPRMGISTRWRRLAPCPLQRPRGCLSLWRKVAWEIVRIRRDNSCLTGCRYIRSKDRWVLCWALGDIAHQIIWNSPERISPALITMDFNFGGMSNGMILSYAVGMIACAHGLRHWDGVCCAARTCKTGYLARFSAGLYRGCP